VWVDGLDRLRSYSGHTPTPPGELSGMGPLAFREDFYDFGVPVHVTPPTPDTPRCARDSSGP
jgi:hypothetical protein